MTAVGLPAEMRRRVVESRETLGSQCRSADWLKILIVSSVIMIFLWTITGYWWAKRPSYSLADQIRDEVNYTLGRAMGAEAKP